MKNKYLFDYCRSVFGYAAENGVSLYELTGRALISNGHIKQQYESHKDFVVRYYDMIVTIIDDNNEVLEKSDTYAEDLQYMFALLSKPTSLTVHPDGSVTIHPMNL